MSGSVRRAPGCWWPAPIGRSPRARRGRAIEAVSARSAYKEESPVDYLFPDAHSSHRGSAIGEAAGPCAGPGNGLAVNWSIHSSPNAFLAACWLWNLHVTRRLGIVEVPPRATDTMWSSSSRRVEPQTPPDATGHWHRRPSRVQTARFTSAGMWRGSAEGRAGDGRGFFTRRAATPHRRPAAAALHRPAPRQPRGGRFSARGTPRDRSPYRTWVAAQTYSRCEQSRDSRLQGGTTHALLPCRSRPDPSHLDHHRNVGAVPTV